MNNCPNCGCDLSGNVGTQGDSYSGAIERAKERLEKKFGFGIPDTKRTYKHIKDILKNLPIVKASKDFESKLERKIQKYESKISQSKRKGSTKSIKG